MIALLLACLWAPGGPAATPPVQSRNGADRTFAGSEAGEGRIVEGVKLCWCPPGTFKMGSPPGEVERRPDETQVDVTLTRGFWMGKFAVTQGQWKRVMGKLPGELTPKGGDGDNFPVYNVNFAEAEAFCRKLTQQAHQSRLPADWEFRLPTEAQREYACRAGTTTATAFGNQLSSKQSNFQGKPYNGAEVGPSLNRATEVGSYSANAWGLCDMQGNVCECAAMVSREAARRDRSGPFRGQGYDQSRRHLPASPRRRLVTTAGPTDQPSPAFRTGRRADYIGFRVVLVKP